MANSAQYADALTRLLPPGKAFSRDPESTLAQLILAMADEFARLDGRCLDLINEADPRTSVEILPNWEQTCGLPDPAIPAPVGIPARQAAVVARLVSIADQTFPGYQDLIAAFGYTLTSITKRTPFYAGVGYAGAPLLAAVDVYWLTFNVTVPAGTTTPDVAMEHEVRLNQLAHVFIDFSYTEAP